MLVSLSYYFFTVGSLQTTHREVTMGHILKMIHEERIDQGTSCGSNYRNGLRRHLLRNLNSETSCNLFDQLNENRRDLLPDPMLGHVCPKARSGDLRCHTAGTYGLRRILKVFCRIFCFLRFFLCEVFRCF